MAFTLSLVSFSCTGPIIGSLLVEAASKGSLLGPAVGMFGLSLANNQWTAALAGIVYGMSIGINMPTIFAWTADLAKPGKVALALGTMLMALEVGIGAGAVFSGHYFGGDLVILK